MNDQSFWDRRKNKRLQKSFQEMRPSLTNSSDYHHPVDDDFMKQIFPNIYQTGRNIDITYPIQRNEKVNKNE
jgi:hypothetical protein